MLGWSHYLCREGGFLAILNSRKHSIDGETQSQTEGSNGTGIVEKCQTGDMKFDILKIIYQEIN